MTGITYPWPEAALPEARAAMQPTSCLPAPRRAGLLRLPWMSSRTPCRCRLSRQALLPLKHARLAATWPGPPPTSRHAASSPAASDGGPAIPPCCPRTGATGRIGRHRSGSYASRQVPLSRGTAPHPAAATPPGERVGLDDPAGRYRTTGLEPLTRDLQGKFVKTTERAQVRARDGGVRHGAHVDRGSSRCCHADRVDWFRRRQCQISASSSARARPWS